MLIFHLQRGRTAKTSNKSYFQTFRELFTIPRVRRATLAAYTTMLAQQLCGINIVAFYSSTIFVEARFTTYAAELASTIFGLVNFIGAFPAVWTMDTLGRRSLLLLTLPFMAFTMGIAGASFSIPDDHSTLRFGMTTAMIYLFCLLYSPGMGPVPTVYSAEVFPLSHRELGTSSAVAVTNLFASLLSLTFPWLLGALGSMGSFMLYAALNVVTLGLVFLFVPETKRKSLEELDGVFEVSTASFVRDKLRRITPPWMKTWLPT
jgi:MFS family permease